MPFSEESYRGEVEQHSKRPMRKRLFTIIFGTNTPAGKAFDIVLLVLIVLSVLAVMLESVSFIAERYGRTLRIIEWVVTIFFTVEYIARIWVVSKPRRYILSWLGLIDLFSILPTYLSLVFVGTQSIAILRALRLLRVFRILKLVRYVSEARILGRALMTSRHRIVVFFLFVLIMVFILGSIMYLIEGPESGFNSIPLSVYWAIVTLTTVGFGDITPATIGGQIIASFIMLLGYSIIAIPTGIVGAQMYRDMNDSRGSGPKCRRCGFDRNSDKALYCSQCGDPLRSETEHSPQE